MPSEIPRRPALRLGGCLLLIAILVVGGLLVLSWLVETPTPGVDLAPELDAYVWEVLEADGRLVAEEEVLAFYDLTRSLDGSHAVVVTDRRVLLYRQEREQFVRWGPGSELRRRPSGKRDQFEVTGSGGVITFEVTAGHGADRLEQVMRRAMAAAPRAAEVTAPALDVPDLIEPPPDEPASDAPPAPE